MLLCIGRLLDLESKYGRTRDQLCRIYLHMLHLIERRFGQLITWWPGLNEPARLLTYRAQITAKDCPVPNVYGFVDGTARFICRPTRHQRAAFSGHKRHHVIKFQGIATPDGLLPSVMGPYEGRRNDNYMLNESGTEALCTQACGCAVVVPAGGHSCLYADSGYGIRQHVLTPYPGAAGLHAEDPHRRFNEQMAKVRISNEWFYGTVTAQWSKVDFNRKNRLFLSPIGIEYRVAIFLTNLFTCLYGNVTSRYFNCQPPSIRVYLGL